MKKQIITLIVLNVYGEAMTLSCDEEGGLWFKHEDCNEDFEELNTAITKYVLNVEEQQAIKDFVSLAKNLAERKLVYGN